MIVIDGNDKVVGRTGTYVSKKLLLGERVVIVNAEKMVFSGSKRTVFKKYYDRRKIKPKQNPRHKPKWSRRPDLLVRRILRGMLPWKTERGRKAFRRLKVFIGVPDEYKDVEKIILDGKYDGSRLVHRITVKELSEMLGYQTKQPGYQTK